MKWFWGKGRLFSKIVYQTSTSNNSSSSFPPNFYPSQSKAQDRNLNFYPSQSKAQGIELEEKLKKNGIKWIFG